MYQNGATLNGDIQHSYRQLTNNIYNMVVKDHYLGLQYPLCTASAVQADALIHTIIGGEIVAHLVAVATAFILCPAVGAALCLRRLLETTIF